jgi:hypothetical protein
MTAHTSSGTIVCRCLPSLYLRSRHRTRHITVWVQTMYSETAMGTVVVQSLLDNDSQVGIEQTVDDWRIRIGSATRSRHSFRNSCSILYETIDKMLKRKLSTVISNLIETSPAKALKIAGCSITFADMSTEMLTIETPAARCVYSATLTRKNKISLAIVWILMYPERTNPLLH